jgi:hypothetical protein
LKKNQFEFVERQIKALGKPPNSKATHTHLVGQHTHTATTHTDAHEAAPANPPVKEPRCLRRRSLAATGGTPRRRPRPAPPPAATRATTGRVAAPCHRHHTHRQEVTSRDRHRCHRRAPAIQGFVGPFVRSSVTPKDMLYSVSVTEGSESFLSIFATDLDSRNKFGYNGKDFLLRSNIRAVQF